MITRNNPDVGYVDESTFAALGFSQVVRADETVYYSGIAPFTGAPPDFTVIGVGSMEEQVLFCLDVLERCLESEGQSLQNMVAVTVYATEMPALMATAEHFAKRFGSAPPSSTWVGVTELAHPDQLVEITAIAADSKGGL
ncbi:RidA family protein [Mycolicibacterium moriokaense]|uniref:Enamine deaminase RidA (YjgF/YER057c/UK114 family) n=1 Tax=Mycolicibacterium moriokaense TaxID=39691 RepID=A0A318GYY5_9MYCO|nr:RidA family protein [Mycolicibacterium moriokaense]PXW95304.1 enamine deaminase RidA (YjgF/YER057c/UK114 family) [Mycolicibacterium moriokaense]